MSEKDTALQGERVTANIWRCPDGVYRWTYEFRMLKNPSAIYTVWAVLGISCGIVFLMMLLFQLFNGNLSTGAEWLSLGKMLLILAGILLVLSILGYLVLGAVYGWKYQVLFEMTEEYVRHIQMPKQFEKAEALGWLTAIAGAKTGSAAATGSGLSMASRSSMTTELKNVSLLRIRRGRETIHVDLKLDKNQVYAETADFDFVESFLKEHCVNARIA